METPRKLTVQISKTATGEHDYLQILSEDQFALNIVLIAGKIVVSDRREKAEDRPVRPTCARCQGLGYINPAPYGKCKPCPECSVPGTIVTVPELP